MDCGLCLIRVTKLKTIIHIGIMCEYIQMFERHTSALEVNHRRWKRRGCRQSEPVMGIRKHVKGSSNSAARDWSQESSFSWSSSRKQTAAWFPLKADSVNASTCLANILWKWKRRKLWKETQTKRRREYNYHKVFHRPLHDLPLLAMNSESLSTFTYIQQLTQLFEITWIT